MRLSLAITVSALLFGSYVVAMPTGKRKATNQDPQSELWLGPGEAGRQRRRMGGASGEASGSQSSGQVPANWYSPNSADHFRPHDGLPFGSNPADRPDPHGSFLSQGPGSLPQDLFFPPHFDHHDPLGLELSPAAHNPQFPPHHDPFQIPGTEPFHFDFGSTPAAHNPPLPPHHDPFQIPGTEPFHFDFGSTPASHSQQFLPHVEHQAHHIPGPEPFHFGPDPAAPHNPHAEIPLHQPRPIHAIVHHPLLDPVPPSERLPTPIAQDQVHSGGNGAYRCSSCGHSSPGPGRDNGGRSRTAAGCSGTYRYTCEAHSFGTNRLYDFKRHQRTNLHSNTRRYPCSEPGCSADYTRPYELKKHERTHRRQ